ncbi:MULTISPECIES: glycosyltransferase family 2 protein [unclassified Salinibacterium]|uniref:glycosyltransferase family 2 protein n=1 Tax=unclassified Salinibacterium TaxID=2632331 RepID=UPI00143DB051|nr:MULTISPECIES: glycosyltransferase family 2 protein [unclassified Salinibacterium]
MSNEPSGAGTSRVTIVIPVYGDWDSLRDCVRSLIEYAPAETYDVLLVNDCGPEADAIEAGIRGLIYGKPQFRYERNPHNLGFGLTCNRAVFELDTSPNDIILLNSDTVVTAGAFDEMRAVLHSSPRNGTVCPRSNDATIATIPFHQRDSRGERDAARTDEVFAAVHALLPRFYISPVSVGFCLLIRRTLINEFGLFDEVFGRGYNEENDFCLRINEAGYSSLIANHALVRHVGSTSFGSAQRTELEAKNSRILHERYPFYPRAVANFIRHGYSAVDRFADLLVEDGNPRKPKVLIDLAGSKSISGNPGEAEIVLSALRLVSSKADLTVVPPLGAKMTTAPCGDPLRLIDREAIDEVFDIAITTSPVTSLEQLLLLNRFALRWVTTSPVHKDLRSTRGQAQAPHTSLTYRLTLEFGDLLLLQDDSALDDMEILFGLDLPQKALQREALFRHGAVSEWERLLTEASAAPVDVERLARRDHLVRPLSLAADALTENLRETAHSLDEIQRSKTYALARKVTSLSAPFRRRPR